MKRAKQPNYRPADGIEVRPSRGKGRGVFALRSFRKGETVERAPALLVPEDDADDLLTSFLGRYLFNADRGTRQAIGLGYTSLINHSEAPNAEFRVASGSVTISTLRAIARGEELTIDYGWDADVWRKPR